MRIKVPDPYTNEYFGELVETAVEVTNTVHSQLNASLVNHTISAVMCAGETRKISIIPGQAQPGSTFSPVNC